MEGPMEPEWGKWIDATAEETFIDEQELYNRFHVLLLEKPQLHYHPDLVEKLGDDAKCSDDIILIWEKINGHFARVDKLLDRDGDIERDDISVPQGVHQAEPTVVQIAKLVSIYGEPKVINYTRFDTLWRIGDPNAQTFHEIVFEYSKVADDVLRLARGIDSSYKNMSLAEIGKSLVAS